MIHKRLLHELVQNAWAGIVTTWSLAALDVQRYWRGYQARQAVAFAHFAANIIQIEYREFSKRVYDLKSRAACTIQRWTRRGYICKPSIESIRLLLEAEAK